jgi:hypothetical protein
LPRLAVIGFHLVSSFIKRKGIGVVIYFKANIAPFTAVTSVRSPLDNELFPSKRDTTWTPFSGFNYKTYTIYKHKISVFLALDMNYYILVIKKGYQGKLPNTL